MWLGAVAKVERCADKWENSRSVPKKKFVYYAWRFHGKFMSVTNVLLLS